VRGSWRIWGTVVALVVLHFLLHLGFGLGREAPDLLTIALLLGSRELRMGGAAGLGFGLGLLEDAFSVLSFGGNTMAMTITGAAGARTRALFVGDSLLFLVLYLFLGKWLRDLILWVAVGSDLRGPFAESMVLYGSVGAFYAAAVGVLAIWVSGSRSESRT
jgi:rod shape-determining protein MreD